MQFHLVQPHVRHDSGENESPCSGRKLLLLQDSPHLMQVGKKFILSAESNIKVKEHDVSSICSLYPCVNTPSSPSLV